MYRDAAALLALWVSKSSSPVGSYCKVWKCISCDNWQDAKSGIKHPKSNTLYKMKKIYSIYKNRFNITVFRVFCTVKLIHFLVPIAWNVSFHSIHSGVETTQCTIKRVAVHLHKKKHDSLICACHKQNTLSYFHKQPRHRSTVKYNPVKPLILPALICTDVWEA